MAVETEVFAVNLSIFWFFAHTMKNIIVCERSAKMHKIVGRASISLDEGVYIVNSASVVGTKEGEGPLGHLFDRVGTDDLR